MIKSSRVLLPIKPFALEDRSGSVRLLVSAALSVDIPPAAGAIGDAWELVGLVEAGQLHLSSDRPRVLLNAAFSVSGKPLLNTYAAQTLAPAIADCDIWSRLDMRLDPRPDPSPHASSTIQFACRHNVPSGMNAPLDTRISAQFHRIDCSFDLCPGVPSPSRSRKRRRGNQGQFLLSVHADDCLDPNAEVQGREGELTAFSHRLDTEASLGEGLEKNPPLPSPPPTSQESIPSSSYHLRARKSSSKPGREQGTTLQTQAETIVKHEKTASLLQAGLQFLLEGKRSLSSCKVLTDPESPSLLRIAPAVFSLKHRGALADRMELLAVVSSALTVAKNAQSPALRMRFETLNSSLAEDAEGEGDGGDEPSPDSHSRLLAGFERRLCRLVLAETPVSLPNKGNRRERRQERQEFRQRSTVHGRGEEHALGAPAAAGFPETKPVVCSASEVGRREADKKESGGFKIFRGSFNSSAKDQHDLGDAYEHASATLPQASFSGPAQDPGPGPGPIPARIEEIKSRTNTTCYDHHYEEAGAPSQVFSHGGLKKEVPKIGEQCIDCESGVQARHVRGSAHHGSGLGKDLATDLATSHDDIAICGWESD